MTSGGGEQIQKQVQEPIQHQPPTAAPETQTIAVMQQITVEMPKQGFHVVDKARWERIEGRVMKMGHRAIDWLAAGWAFFGVAVSAGIALLVLPHATTRADAVSPSVRPALWAALIAGAILWAVFAAFHFSDRRQSGENAFDICNEMRVARGADEMKPPAAWWRRAGGSVVAKLRGNRGAKTVTGQGAGNDGKDG